jgi:hypothetical protein
LFEALPQRFNAALRRVTPSRFSRYKTKLAKPQRGSRVGRCDVLVAEVAARLALGAVDLLLGHENDVNFMLNNIILQ